MTNQPKQPAVKEPPHEQPGSSLTTVLSGVVPITIGITGHRDIHPDALKAISEQLYLVLIHIKAHCPNTPLFLISPLAEGADQLAAQIALELQIDVIAALPMNKNEYERDFNNEDNESNDCTDAKQTFNELLSKSTHIEILGKFNPGEQRDLCYANVGKWLVDQSDVVIALWDGSLATQNGGTGQVVNYALSGEFACLAQQTNSSDWLAMPRPVIHIQTARQSTDSPISSSEPQFYLNKQSLDAVPSDRIKKAIKDYTPFKNIDKFNKTICSIDTAGSYPLLEQNIANLPSSLNIIHNLYIKSDSVANKFQKAFSRYTLIFYILTSMLLVTLLLYLRVVPLTVVLATYVSLYVITIAVSWRIKHSQYQRKYHLHRSMGELSRLFFFFKLYELGSTKQASVLESYRELQYMHRKIGDENSWVIDVFRKTNIFAEDGSASRGQVNSLELVKKHWIEDQHKYFSNALKRHERKLAILHWAELLFFAISLVCGLALVGASFLHLPLLAGYKSILSASIGITAGLGGILKTYSFSMGLNGITGRYRLMATLFENAHKRLITKNSNSDAIFTQVWWEALMENVEWFSVSESRQVKTVGINSVLEGISKVFKR